MPLPMIGRASSSWPLPRSTMSKRTLSYKWYNAEEVILVKKMLGCGLVWHSGICFGVLEEILLVHLQRTGLGRMAQIPGPWLRLREEVWELPDLVS
uniref:Uncharacterized protein n=1 Tax=Triticum urartu TaxID=4572 RepID=A0A8R7UH59_TRIUA